MLVGAVGSQHQDTLPSQGYTSILWFDRVLRRDANSKRIAIIQPRFLQVMAKYGAAAMTLRAACSEI